MKVIDSIKKYTLRIWRSQALKYVVVCAAGVLSVLSVIGYLFYAAISGWKYVVLFIMDEKEVTHQQMPRSINTITIMMTGIRRLSMILTAAGTSFIHSGMFTRHRSAPITAPTMGFGLVKPRPFSASASAIRI